jgi:FKBP-type peptidyl-prolyl cis-trans isomerase 2
MAGISSGLYLFRVWENLQDPVVSQGDFVELYYIGYLANGTVFDSSIQNSHNVTPDTSLDETGNITLESLKAYIGDDSPTTYPDGWTQQDYSVVEGFWKGLRDMEEGDTKVIGPIPPTEGYGLPISANVSFRTATLTGIDLSFQIVNLSDDVATLLWTPSIGEIFTMPQYWGVSPIEVPLWLWENATEVIMLNDTTAVVKTTPTKLTDLTFFPIDIFENTSTASFDEDTITITTTPEEGASTEFYGATITVENVTEDMVNISIIYGGNITYDEMPRKETFNRTMELSRLFMGIPLYYLEADLDDMGYSSHELAGQTLYFKVKVQTIYEVN